MTHQTTLKEIKRIAAAENAENVTQWDHKALTELSRNVLNRWFSVTVYGIGSVLVEDKKGNFYFASSRSKAAFVLK